MGVTGSPASNPTVMIPVQSCEFCLHNENLKQRSPEATSTSGLGTSHYRHRTLAI